MEKTEIIAQSIGLVAMAFNILSYQCKEQKRVIAMQLCGTTLFTVNYFLLGAMVGSLLNAIGAVRAVLFLFKKKLKTDNALWFAAFIVTYVAVYVLSFTVFGKAITPKNIIIEVLPVIGMVAGHIGFRLKSAADVRRCGLVSSPSWLIYNTFAGSWGAIACEVMALMSIIIGMIRHDRKGRQA